MSIDKRISWIINGELTHVLPGDVGMAASDFEVLSRYGAIKIVESYEGVEFRWVLFSANWSSVMFLLEWLHLHQGPFTLRYFASGWFTERIETAVETKVRINELLAKSDLHITRHTIAQKSDPDTANVAVPHVLRDTLADLRAIPDISVDCMYDADTRRFTVQRVGPQSEIAKIYGLSPVSTPCLAGNSYDEVVSEAYLNVLETEEPHYGHVLAAMNTPDKTVNWMPYQRVVLPHRFADGSKGVSVITERADVDIKLF